MEKFMATKVDDTCIELSTVDELNDLFELLETDDNFILQWHEDGVLCSKVIIATNISAKVKTGEIVLTSKE